MVRPFASGSSDRIVAMIGEEKSTSRLYQWGQADGSYSAEDPTGSAHNGLSICRGQACGLTFCALAAAPARKASISRESVLQKTPDLERPGRAVGYTRLLGRSPPRLCG